MSLVKKILNHSFWLLIGNSIGRLAMFLTNIVAARLLPQEIFGQFMMIRSTISSVEGILSGALGSPMIKRVSEIAHKDQEKLNRILSALFFTNMAIATILALLLYFFSPLLIQYFFIGQSELVHGLAIGAVLLITTTLSSMMQTILTGLEEFKKLAFAGIGASVTSFPLIAAFIYFFGLYGAIWGVILYFFSDFGWKYFQLRKKVSLSCIHNFTSLSAEGKRLLSFSIPLFLSVVVTGISFWYARVMVVKSTDSFAQIAIFDAAYQWLTIIMIITGATTSVALPMLSRAFGKSDKSEISQVFWINLSINLGISSIMALLFIFFAKQIMSLYGETYISGYKILMILGAVSIFFTLSSLLNKYIIVHNRSWVVFISSVIGSISLFMTLIPYLHYAEYALAGSFLIFYITSCLVYGFSILYIKKTHSNVIS